MTPPVSPSRLFIKIERCLHDAWGAWCAKFGPKLKITTDSPAICDRILIRAASQTEWTDTLEAAYYGSAETSIIIKHPAVSLCHLKVVSIIGRESFLFTHPHELLRLDSSMDSSPIKKIRRPIGFISRRIKGSALSLGSRYTDNHYHFLFEHLPLILLAREYIGAGSALNILITPGQSWWQKEYLTKLGEAPERIIELCHGTLKCEDAWVIPNHPLKERALPFEAGIYREIARRLKKGINQTNRNRRVFITRKDAHRRRLHNEDEIFMELQHTYPNLELVSLSSTSLNEQIAIFSETCLIISPAGQAVRNIIFCEGALLIELIPGRRNPENIFHEWARTVTHLAMAQGNRHLPLYSDSDYHQDESDWMFPVTSLKKALLWLESHGGGITNSKEQSSCP